MSRLAAGGNEIIDSGFHCEGQELGAERQQHHGVGLPSPAEPSQGHKEPRVAARGVRVVQIPLGSFHPAQPGGPGDGRVSWHAPHEARQFTAHLRAEPRILGLLLSGKHGHGVQAGLSGVSDLVHAVDD